jgi:hypothetical protein
MALAADSEVHLGVDVTPGARAGGEVGWNPWLQARIAIADRMHLVYPLLVHLEPRRGEVVDVALFGGVAGLSGYTDGPVFVYGAVGAQVTARVGDWRFPAGLALAWVAPGDELATAATLRVAPRVRVGPVELCLGIGVTADAAGDRTALRLGSTLPGPEAPSWDRGIARPSVGIHLTERLLAGLSTGLVLRGGTWTPSAAASLALEF